MWEGGTKNYNSFLDTVGNGMGVAYSMDPELASRLQTFIQTGEEIAGLAQTLAGGSDADKGATIQAIVRIVIAAYTQAIERRAAKSKAEKDRILAEARAEFFEKIIDNAAAWPYDVSTVPHISISIKGGGIWTTGGDFQPAIYKPEYKSSSQYRYLRPGPSRNPRGCAGETDRYGSVEGTDSSKCKGQIAIYPLLYPCWRERSLSTSGEFIRSSDRDNPGAQMLDLQIRAILEPEVNLNIPLTSLKEVVMKFEMRFWAAVHKRKNVRRDLFGFVGDVMASRTGGDTYPGVAGLAGRVGSPHATPRGKGITEWVNGIQVLNKEPSDPNPDQRFYRDENGIIRAIWNDEDLETCFVLGPGSALWYDSDTGSTGSCTVAARNAIWAQWLNISTARQFWGTRDYIREQWKNGDFSVDASALDVLGYYDIPKRAKKKLKVTGGLRVRDSDDGGGAAVAVVGAGLVLGLVAFLRR